MTHDPVAQTAPHKVVIMARGLGTRMRKSVEESPYGRPSSCCFSRRQGNDQS